MLVMVVEVMVTVARGVGAARIRTFIALHFWEEPNNGLKWVMSTGTHKIGFLIHMAVINNEKSPLEVSWWPIYETNVNKKMHFR